MIMYMLSTTSFSGVMNKALMVSGVCSVPACWTLVQCQILMQYKMQEAPAKFGNCIRCRTLHLLFLLSGALGHPSLPTVSPSKPFHPGHGFSIHHLSKLMPLALGNLSVVSTPPPHAGLGASTLYSFHTLTFSSIAISSIFHQPSKSI